MEKKNYPYLAKNTVGEKTYVVLFCEKDHGVVLNSEITDKPQLAFGAIGDFDEDSFEVLPNEVRIYIQN